MFSSPSVAGSCGVRSTGCSWVSDSRFVSPSTLCAPCVWTSTAARLPTRTRPQRGQRLDRHGLQVQLHPLKQKLNLNRNLLLNMTGQRKSRRQNVFPPLPREGGSKAKSVIDFSCDISFYLSSDQMFGHKQVQCKRAHTENTHLS